MTWAGHVERVGKKRNPYKVLVRKPERKESPVTPRCRCEDNIKVDLREMRWGDQLRALVTMVMDFRVAYANILGNSSVVK
jgi:hypothetical protein